MQTENASDPKEETRTGRIGTSALKVFALVGRRHILFLLSAILFSIDSTSIAILAGVVDVVFVVGIMIEP